MSDPQSESEIAESAEGETAVATKPPRFSKKILRDGVKSPDAGKRLEASFNSCVEGYKSKNKDNPETAELFQFVPAPPPKEKKTADATH